MRENVLSILSPMELIGNKKNNDNVLLNTCIFRGPEKNSRPSLMV